MADKPAPSPPSWIKNTYFWISAALIVVGILGLPFIKGDAAIRDPGQRREEHLYLIYFGAALVMLINGVLSHSQTIQHYREMEEPSAPK